MKVKPDTIVMTIAAGVTISDVESSFSSVSKSYPHDAKYTITCW